MGARLSPYWCCTGRHLHCCYHNACGTLHSLLGNLKPKRPPSAEGEATPYAKCSRKSAFCSLPRRKRSHTCTPQAESLVPSLGGDDTAEAKHENQRTQFSSNAQTMHEELMKQQVPQNKKLDLHQDSRGSCSKSTFQRAPHLWQEIADLLGGTSQLRIIKSRIVIRVVPREKKYIANTGAISFLRKFLTEIYFLQRLLESYWTFISFSIRRRRCRSSYRQATVR